MDLADALREDPEKPIFHLLPRKGWLNDPNGLFFHKGRYHMCAPAPGAQSCWLVGRGHGQAD